MVTFVTAELISEPDEPPVWRALAWSSDLDLLGSSEKGSPEAAQAAAIARGGGTVRAHLGKARRR